MPNPDLIRRHIAKIREALETLEYYCDSEIVGDDARHLLDDIKGANRELLWVKPEELSESYQIKPLYDRLKSVQSSLRVLRNTLDRSDKEIDFALEACSDISNAVEEVNDEDDNL
jgi:hypothetical protein